MSLRISRRFVEVTVTALLLLLVIRLLTEPMPSAASLYGDRAFGILFSEGCADGLGRHEIPPSVPLVTKTPPMNISFDNAFGACLIIKGTSSGYPHWGMLLCSNSSLHLLFCFCVCFGLLPRLDDNHLLAEWLAYHYHVLPLRRLIVGIDAYSETSPTAILDRYRKTGMMKITEWGEVDIMPPSHLSRHVKVAKNNKAAKSNLYVDRQKNFYAKCMAVLTLEGLPWATFTDTDEYILPNTHVHSMFRLQDTANKTILEILSNTENQRISPTIKEGCVGMSRLQFGHKESVPSIVQKHVPLGFNGSHFSTLRWHYHGPPWIMKPAKCMVDLRLTLDTDFDKEEVDPHRPNKRLCPKERLFVPLNESSFVVNHYSGSWEQWNYRKDIRLVRRKEHFDKLYFEDEAHQDHTISPWLHDFVARHGHEMASYLLQGAGRQDSTPDYDPIEEVNVEGSTQTENSASLEIASTL